jgi:hypothetical protein
VLFDHGDLGLFADANGDPRRTLFQVEQLF